MSLPAHQSTLLIVFFALGGVGTLEYQFTKGICLAFKNAKTDEQR
jgi:hypothetical protein